ncbi:MULTISPECIES: MarR family winged helix-turn-helix transcriptional regulator [Tsukamurella]|uniref:MarR family winged helix-turn-helix transcriptional regulator n=1 Tax=Tsukamurella TaxID=2060 RepID=UPI001E289CCC|nr:MULTISPECIES: MarR family transcriptional regulator [Tsukamurella]
MQDVDAAMAQWHTEYPDLDTLPMSVIGRLANLEAAGRAAIEVPLEHEGLRRGEFDVLATLRRCGAPYALSPASLADQLLITRAGLTSRLDRLETAGLVARSPNPADGRGKTVTLTAHGRRLVERVLPGHVERERELLSALTREELQTLDALLRRLTAG